MQARPALPLAEVESHPLSNFPAHYSGDLEDVPKDMKKEEKKAEDSAPAAKKVSVPNGFIEDFIQLSVIEKLNVHPLDRSLPRTLRTRRRKMRQ